MSSRFFSRLLVICASVLVFASAASAKTFHLTSTPLVPAAAGNVDVDRDKNGNLKIDLNVEHLAHPASLTPPATVYTVWFRERDQEPQSQGQLRIHDDLKGDLKTTTPLRDFEVIITAENDDHARIPSDRVAMRTHVQAP